MHLCDASDVNQRTGSEVLGNAEPTSKNFKQNNRPAPPVQQMPHSITER
jgi:hypothetical protein